LGTAPEPVQRVGEADAQVADGIATLVAQTRGAPPLLCALAARAVDAGDWMGGMRAPAPPLEDIGTRRLRGRREALSESERALLLSSVTAADACTREVAVRLLGRDGGDAVVSGLIGHATSEDAAVRAAAAYGLGLIGAAESVGVLVAMAADPAAA